MITYPKRSKLVLWHPFLHKYTRHNSVFIPDRYEFWSARAIAGSARLPSCDRKNRKKIKSVSSMLSQRSKHTNILLMRSNTNLWRRIICRSPFRFGRWVTNEWNGKRNLYRACSFWCFRFVYAIGCRNVIASQGISGRGYVIQVQRYMCTYINYIFATGNHVSRKLMDDSRTLGVPHCPLSNEQQTGPIGNKLTFIRFPDRFTCVSLIRGSISLLWFLRISRCLDGAVVSLSYVQLHEQKSCYITNGDVINVWSWHSIKKKIKIRNKCICMRIIFEEIKK